MSKEAIRLQTKVINATAKLHRLGFKTFNGIIDESFDDENDLNKRIELINIEIEKLCSSDLPDFLKKTKNICLYNQQHYINNRQYHLRQENCNKLLSCKQIMHVVKYTNG